VTASARLSFNRTIRSDLAEGVDDGIDPIRIFGAEARLADKLESFSVDLGARTGHSSGSAARPKSPRRDCNVKEIGFAGVVGGELAVDRNSFA
jgi:hypothetical protein